jgi:epoxyqueuosine reductase
MQDKIKDHALRLGVDDVGIAAVRDYHSPRSPSLDSIMPEVNSLVVLAYKELSNCESENPQIAMGGRLDIMEFARSCNYRMARFLEKEMGAKAMAVPLSYPMNMSAETNGMVADVSLRHAAVAAGLGSFGRHNLVIHPELGSRAIFSAILTDLDLDSDPPISDKLCNDCEVCVENCPVGALDQEGITDGIKCIRNSQPYGLPSYILFWLKFIDASPDERKAMVIDENFWRLYQAGFIGFQYFCFNCQKDCPL